MKIVFTTDQIYLHGGIEKVMATKANYFVDVLGYDVFIITTEQKNNKPCYTLSPKIQLIDIGINYCRHKSYISLVNLKKTISHFSRWNNTIKNINPDVLIVCNIAFDYYWAPFFLRKTKKIKEFHASRFFTEQTRKSTSFIKKISFFINDFIESKYNTLMLLNEDEKNYYRSNNLAIIPNPIEIQQYVNAPLTATKAIAAGRIVAVKGFESAILAWKVVAEKHPDWQLDIFGQGEKKYISQLEDLIKQNNLSSNVFIYEAVSDLQERMLGYSFYVMTSVTECFPMILLESLMVGLPIISYDCPHGPRNIITNGEDGFVVENQNTMALAAKINYLIENPILRLEMGEKGKHNVKRFSAQNVIKQWLRLF